MNNKYQFIVEKIEHDLEKFKEVKIKVDGISRSYLDFLKKVNPNIQSVDVLYQINSIYQTEDGKEILDWKVTLTETENVFGNTQIVSRVMNDQLSIYETVPQTDFVYKMINKKTEEVEYQGDVFNLNKHLEEKYSDDIYSIPEDWSNDYRVETYYVDKYNGTEVKMEDGESQIF